MADSSTTTVDTTETPVDTTQVSDANTAASSPADTLGAKSMVDAVTAALNPSDADNEPSPSSTTPEKESAENATTPGKEGEVQPLSDEERRGISVKTAKRFEQLLGSNRAQRTEIEKVSSERDVFKGKAENYDRLNGFLVENRLDSQDVNTGFEIMAAMKNDPVKAWELIQPIYQQLRDVVGQGNLPADLAEKVRLGYTDEATARETARLRVENQHTNRRMTEQQQRDAENRQRDEQAAMIGQAKSTAGEWEDAKRKTDPDWHLKQTRIHEKVQLALLTGGADGFPKTKADVVKMLEGIYTDVTKEMKAFAPKPSRIDPHVSGRASPKSVAEPKTFLEAVQAGIASR